MSSNVMKAVGAAFVSLLLLAGCQTVTEPEPEAPREAPSEPRVDRDDDAPPTVEAPARPRVDAEGDLLDAEGRPVSRVFYFEFDRSELKPEARDQLREHARYLRDNSSARVVIYGHTDERGTREYNLALGERRAASVRSFLQGEGVSSRQIRIVSYGEERPVDPRSNEEAWALNRRAELAYQ